jgi:hypothetical protein
VNLQTLIACAVIFCVFLYLKHRQSRQDENEPAYFDALELSDAVRELESVMEQLENADRMTTDLATCEPGLLHRFFRAQWLSSDGKNHTIDLCARGRDRATRGLAAAAQAERDRLNQEAIDRIRALAWAIESGDSSQATVFEPLPDDQTEDETAGQSGKNSGQNDKTRHSWGSV